MSQEGSSAALSFRWSSWFTVGSRLTHITSVRLLIKAVIQIDSVGIWIQTIVWSWNIGTSPTVESWLALIVCRVYLCLHVVWTIVSSCARGLLDGSCRTGGSILAVVSRQCLNIEGIIGVEEVSHSTWISVIGAKSTSWVNYETLHWLVRWSEGWTSSAVVTFIAGRGLLSGTPELIWSS